MEELLVLELEVPRSKAFFIWHKEHAVMRLNLMMLSYAFFTLLGNQH
jgi:hypothetical protein